MTDRTLTRPFDDLGSAVLEAARASTRASLDGAQTALGMQRRLLAGTPLEPLTELFAAQISLARTLLEPVVAADEDPATGVLAAIAATPPPTRTARSASPQRQRRGAPAHAQPATAPTAAKPAAPAAPAQATTAPTAAKPAAPATKPARARRTAAQKPATRATTRRTRTAPVAVAPIAGYAGLTADELVAKLRDLSQTDLAAVLAYEQDHDARTTVLERVRALREDEPAPGYDALNAQDVIKIVADGSPETAAKVRAYERRHKNRSTVIEAADRAASDGT